MLYAVEVLTFKSVNKILELKPLGSTLLDAVYRAVYFGFSFQSVDKSLNLTIQMKATGQYFPVMLVKV